MIDGSIHHISWFLIFISESKRIFTFILNLCKLMCAISFIVVSRIVDEVVATEQMFLLMTNLYAFICQFVFFTLCDVILLPTDLLNPTRNKVISGLTTLLLYSIITYFLTRLQSIFKTSMQQMNRAAYRRRDYIIWLLKVLLEWAKACIIVLCLREQGLQYHFNPFYSITTFVYYVCTEKLFVDGIIYAARFCNIQRFDSLEHLYIPIILHCITISQTILLVAYLLSMTYTSPALTASYFILYLPIKDMFWNYINPLMLEQKTFATFRIASEKDLTQWNDICAVCLDHMSRARITPCNHLFHPQCLKRCLQTSFQCPLCKTDLVQSTC